MATCDSCKITGIAPTKSIFLDVKHTDLKVKSSQNQNGISCSKCTFLNLKTATRCQMCKNPLEVKSSQNQNGVSCSTCTFLNLKSASRCQMCQNELLTIHLDDDTGVETCGLWEFFVRLFS